MGREKLIQVLSYSTGHRETSNQVFFFFGEETLIMSQSKVMRARNERISLVTWTSMAIGSRSREHFSKKKFPWGQKFVGMDTFCG